MNSLSLVIITFNEQENIDRCLKSVCQIADEIIIIDSLSTDATKEIASRFNVQFHERAWEGFSAAKNFGNSLCTKDWILSIDADEELSDDLIRSLEKFKSKESAADVFSVNRLTNYCGHWIRYCGWYPDQKKRIWKRGQGMWKGVLHEELHFTEKVTSAVIKGDLLHYSFPTISSHIKTLNNYSETAARDLVERGKSLFFPFHILIKPSFTFFRMYFLKLGFLDGYYGFVVCSLSAFANFVKFVKAYQMKKNKHL